MQTQVRKPNPHPELDRLRSRIDDVDAGLVDLMAARVELAREEVAVRQAAGLSAEDLAREAAIVRRASSLARARGVEPDATREVFWRLIGLARWATNQAGEDLGGRNPTEEMAGPG